ncbi:MAG: PSD1 and planctomycete cytochrome C domain-containing protein [Planctomycetota bacterium]|nr:PSD1 and planctomycete cytochrome C domain-containing protein [Planctomycetota bacterium]
MTLSRRIFLAFSLLIVASHSARAQNAEGIKFFESNIRPVLVEHCYECHSTKSDKARGGLKVDSRDAMLRGGDSGPAIVSESLTKSLLYGSLLYGDDSDYQMPPKGKLPDSVIADFRKWILMGAPDPRVTTINANVDTKVDLEKGRTFWAYQTPVRTSPSKIKSSSWARTPIDGFVVATLDEQGLAPVDDADARTLVRRMFFVITGLPPAPDEMTDWTKRIDEASSEQSRQIAVSQLVDQLLESPRYGERWGRHWMDVARFAESTGGDQNNIYQHAWRYRDYLIDAFNNDKPFDDFIREQIAGDLLPIKDDREWADNVIATGFLAVGVKLVGEEDQQKLFADLIDEQIDTTTRAFLGTTVACARCHDHKFDPIPQEDYYALAGMFRATTTYYGLIKAQARQATTLLDLTGLGPPHGTPALSKKELADLIADRDAARAELDEAMKKIRSGVNVFRGTLRRLRSQRDETEAALQGYSEAGEPRVFAMGTQDREFPLPTRLLVRGELDKPAQEVPRGVLQVLSPAGRHTLAARMKDSSIRRRLDELGSPSYRSISGRLELADWIASPDNPLTARVIANRVWHWMFGRGLVRTVDDFGQTGDAPTHPELLDFLAIRLIENNWSIKSLVREIALTRTWQLASSFDESNFTTDPDNRFLWRMNKRRLEAEVVRDAMLAVSGQLDLNRPLGTYLRAVGEGGVGQNVFEPVIRGITANTRSVYLPRVRNVLPEILDVFDAPDASFVTGSRETTSSPLQSLFLMNNPFVQRQAEALTDRVSKYPASERLESACMLALGRGPSETEIDLAMKFISDVSNASSLTTEQKLAAYCQALLCAAEFSSID